jgi:hypothetical protein
LWERLEARCVLIFYHWAIDYDYRLSFTEVTP